MDGRAEERRAIEGRKFSRLRPNQVIRLRQASPDVPIEIRKAHERGHHGIETKGAEVEYLKGEGDA